MLRPQFTLDIQVFDILHGVHMEFTENPVSLSATVGLEGVHQRRYLTNAIVLVLTDRGRRSPPSSHI